MVLILISNSYNYFIFFITIYFHCKSDVYKLFYNFFVKLYKYLKHFTYIYVIIIIKQTNGEPP